MCPRLLTSSSNADFSDLKSSRLCHHYLALGVSAGDVIWRGSGWYLGGRRSSQAPEQAGRRAAPTHGSSHSAQAARPATPPLGAATTQHAAAAAGSSQHARISSRKAEFLREMGLLPGTGGRSNSAGGSQRDRRGSLAGLLAPPPSTALRGRDTTGSRQQQQSGDTRPARAPHREASPRGRQSVAERNRQVSAGPASAAARSTPRSSLPTKHGGASRSPHRRNPRAPGPAPAPEPRARRHVRSTSVLSRATASRADGLKVSVAGMLAVLVNTDSSYPLKLQAVHGLNGALMEAKSLAEAERLGSMAAAPKVLQAVLDMVTSGQPHAYIAINALHSLAFCGRTSGLMVTSGTMEVLLGLLRAGGGLERELLHATLSFLVTLATTAEGAARAGQLAAMRPVMKKLLAVPDGRTRRLAHQLLSVLLGNPKGAHAWASLPWVLPTLEQHLNSETDEGQRRAVRDTMGQIQTAGPAP
eukprot:jgi/Tetstr1/442875/TSEL_030938.t1